MKDEHIAWDDLSNETRYAIEAGKKIEAIKLLRAERGIGLKEAKDAVDRLFLEHAPEGTRTGGGCGGALLAWTTLGLAVAEGAKRLLA